MVNGAASGEDVLGDESFLVLNAIYLRKMAPADHVARVTGLPAARADAILAAAGSSNAVLDLGGQYVLTDEGRERVLRYYRQTYAVARAGAVVPAWYERFETLNTQFIKLVTDWQRSDGDERVTDRLVRVVEKQTTALRELATTIPRYTEYALRFEEALTRVDRGERDFVCKPTIDSIHNVWFEFHEDILAVMGRPREA